MKIFLLDVLKKHGLIFGKSQVAAGVATISDFLILAALVEVFGIYYVAAVALASTCGGVINFILNRKWTFQSSSKMGGEALRYFFVCGGSLFLNTSLVWLFTELFVFNYMVSKCIVVVAIGLFWNYPMHRYWVFSQKHST